MNGFFRERLRRLYHGSLHDAVTNIHRHVLRRRSAAIVRGYLKRNAIRRLQLGAGFHQPEGWLNTDFMPRSRDIALLDITLPFPLPNGSFDVILCEHLIEHVPYVAASDAIRECFRVLKAGGRLRIATPDLLRLTALYDRPQEPLASEYSRWIVETFVPYATGPAPCFVVNNAFRNWGHEFLYDEETLTALLSRHGFVDVRRRPPQESSCPELNAVDFHGQCIGSAAFNDYESLILEARKPDRGETNHAVPDMICP